MGVVCWLANVTTYASERNGRVPPCFKIIKETSGTPARHFITTHSSSQKFPAKVFVNSPTTHAQFLIKWRRVTR